MLYTKKFVITVSLCAMLAANPVLAVTNPVEAKAAAKSGKPGEVSTVYSDWAGRAESGIAGVSYVNSAVDVAGNAAQWAENHAAIAAQNAASAAKSASDAAGSASDAAKVLQKAVLRPDDVVENSEPVGSATLPVYVKADGTVETITSYQGKATTAGTADKAIADKNGAQIDTTYEKLSNKVTTLSADSTDTQYPSAKLVRDELDKKVDKDQGVDNKNLAMVTDQKGTVYPGYVDTDMIADGAVTADKIANGGTFAPSLSTPYSGFVLWSDHEGNVSWTDVDDEVLADGAVTSEKIADGAVTVDKLFMAGTPDGSSTTGFLAYSGNYGDGFSGGMEWRLVGANDIATGVVTASKIAEDAVTERNIANYAVTANKIADESVGLEKLYYYNAYASGSVSDGIPLTARDGSGLALSQISSRGIADGAVTIEKTAGVVGMVPVGSADATTYGQFWIE